MEKLRSSRGGQSNAPENATTTSASNLPVYISDSIKKPPARFIGAVVSYKRGEGKGVVRFISCDVDDATALAVPDETDDSRRERVSSKNLVMDEQRIEFDASVLVNTSVARKNELVVMEMQMQEDGTHPSVDLMWIVEPPNGFPTRVSRLPSRSRTTWRRASTATF